MSITREAVEMERVIRLIPLGKLSDLKTFLSFCNTRYPIEKARIIEVVRSFSSSLRELKQEFIDGLSRQIQLIIMRKVIDEIGIENVKIRLLKIDIDKGTKTESITPLENYIEIMYIMKTRLKILLFEYPFKMELYWNEDLIRLFGCDCAEHILPFFEDIYKEDKSPREAIRISRLDVLGEATEQELDVAMTNVKISVSNAIQQTYSLSHQTRDEIRQAASLAATSAQYTIDSIYSIGTASATGCAWWNVHINPKNYNYFSFNRDSYWSAGISTARKWKIQEFLKYLLGEKTVETASELYSSEVN